MPKPKGKQSPAVTKPKVEAPKPEAVAPTSKPSLKRKSDASAPQTSPKRAKGNGAVRVKAAGSRPSTTPIKKGKPTPTRRITSKSLGRRMAKSPTATNGASSSSSAATAAEANPYKARRLPKQPKSRATRLPQFIESPTGKALRVGEGGDSTTTGAEHILAQATKELSINGSTSPTKTVAAAARAARGKKAALTAKVVKAVAAKASAKAAAPAPTPAPLKPRAFAHKNRPSINAAPVRRSDCGNVLVFGNGDCGQLGLGEDIMQRKKPYPLAALNSEQVVDIAAGGLHNMALTADGRLFSWGCNDQRALGREGDEMTPAEVKLPLPVPTGSALHPLNEEQKASVAANAEPMRIIKVACGDSATVALTNYGVYSWGTYRSAEGLLGFNPEREIQATPVRIEGIDDEIVDLSVGADHVLALTRQGDVYGWGDGQQHQLGRRIIERRKRNGLRPTKLGLKHVVLIGTGAYHSFAVTETGDLYAWGLNNFHQCGVDPEDGGDEAIITMPTLVRSLQGIPLAQVTGGEHHSLVLAADGSVYGFGRSDSHQVGLPYTTLPEEVAERARLCEEARRLAEVSGEPFDESEFQTHKKSINRPTKLSDCPLFRQLICGSNHNLALTKEGGDVYSWGYGDMLALGNGEEEDVSTPTLIEGKRLEDARVINIAAGGQHSVLLVQPTN